MEGTDISNGSHILKALNRLTDPTPPQQAADVARAIQTALDAIVSLEQSGQLSYMEADSHNLPTARNMLMDAKTKLAPLAARAEAADNLADRVQGLEDAARKILEYCGPRSDGKNDFSLLCQIAYKALHNK